MVFHDHEAGYTVVPNLLSSGEIAALVAACEARLGDLGTDLRVGDKPAAGTRRLVEADARLGSVAEVVGRAPLLDVVEQILGPAPQRGDVTFRSPQPGFGEQRLHADTLTRLDDAPHTCATALIALCDFTADNGATRVVPGSHRRPDLQRRSGHLEAHPDEVGLVGPAGTAFVFTGHLLHSGTRNRSARPRPALQVTWSRAPDAASRPAVAVRQPG